MELRNNNRQVIKTLARVSYKKNRGRNYLMIGAVALAVITIFSVFSMAAGRYDAEYLMSARSAGKVASTMLESPSKEQAKEIEDLPYVKSTGTQWDFGTVNEDGITVTYTSALTNDTFYEMYEDAFTDINGTYPDSDKEVMMSVRALSMFGVESPQIGQAIDLDIYLDKNKSLKQQFILSGYYTDYSYESEPVSFFSPDILKNIDVNLEDSTVLLIKQNDPFSGYYIEEQLYKDIPTLSDHQQFLGGSSIPYFVIEDMVGGFYIAFGCIFLIFLCVFLLINNIMSISLSNDVKYYGLLKTIGTTKKQIRNIILRQTLKIIMIGIAIGTLLGCITVLTFIPKLLGNLYLNNYGEASSMLGFHIGYLLIAIGFAVLITLISVMGPIRKVNKISPIEAVRYHSVSTANSKETLKSRSGNKIHRLAWRNIILNKKKTIFTIISLTLGLIVALSSMVIIRGLDDTNRINSSPDFEFKAMLGIFSEDRAFNDEFTPLDDIEDDLLSVEGVRNINKSYGNYVVLDSEDDAWQPFLEANNLLEGMQKTEDGKDDAEQIRENFFAGVNIIDNDTIDSLEEYANQQSLNIDFESVRNGKGAICLHYHVFSPTMEKKAQKTIGKEISISPFSGKESTSIPLAGYMDIYAKDMPDYGGGIATNNDIPCLLVSEDAYKSFGAGKKLSRLSYDIKEGFEPTSKIEIEDIVENKNTEMVAHYEEGGHEISSHEDQIYYYSKSDELADAQSYILSMKVIMYTIAGLLLFMGLMNYLNVITTNIISRRKEFSVMEAIGMTRKQLQLMLIWEGMYYATLTGILTVSVGSGVMYALGVYLKGQKDYFVFSYPWFEVLVVMIIMFAFCIVIPITIYRKVMNESVIERLRYMG